jgi:predicted transcriptional regulator
MTEIEIAIMIDEDGDYAVHHDVDAIKERFEEEVGELDGAKAYRLVRLKVNVPTPKPATATINVPDLPNDAAVTLA